MSTEQVPMEPGAAAESTASAGGKSPEANLADELREFGKQIEGMFQTVRTSPRGKEVETQLTAAWRDVEKGVNTAINKAQSSDVKGTVTGTAQYATDEVQSGLARGLHSLNTWMSQKMGEAEARRKKREEEISKAAVSGTVDNQVTDRFGGDAPSFGQGVEVPAAPVNVASEPSALNQDNPIADRFSS